MLDELFRDLLVLRRERIKLAHDERVYQDVECRPVDKAGATADDHFHMWWRELSTCCDWLQHMACGTHDASLVEDEALYLLLVVV